MSCLDFRILQEEGNTKSWATRQHWCFRVWSVREDESNFGKINFICLPQYWYLCCINVVRQGHMKIKPWILSIVSLGFSFWAYLSTVPGPLQMLLHSCLLLQPHLMHVNKFDLGELYNHPWWTNFIYYGKLNCWTKLIHIPLFCLT